MEGRLAAARGFSHRCGRCRDWPRLGVTIWPEPYDYDATPEEEKEQQILSFDADGIAKGVDWLNEQFEGQKARWKAVSRG